MAIGIDAALAQGDLATAAKIADDLMDKASNVEQAFLVAEAIQARARVDAARGEHEAAMARLYRALGDLGSAGFPLQRAAS